MSRNLPLTVVCLALIGAGIYMAWPAHQTPAEDREPATDGAPESPEPGSPSTAESRSTDVGVPGTGRNAAAIPVTPIPSEPAPTTPPANRRFGHPAAPHPYVARRLGWDGDDPRLVFLSQWLGDRRGTEHTLMEAVGSHGGREQVAAMDSYNNAADAWRIQLVQQLGVEAAQQVVDRFCMYHFEPANGSWHRIDATGREVPFKHDDDDIWENGESSNPGWEGHW